MKTKEDKISLFKQKRFDKFSPDSLGVISDYIKELESKVNKNSAYSEIEDERFYDYASNLRHEFRNKIKSLPLKIMILGVSIIIVSQILIEIFL